MPSGPVNVLLAGVNQSNRFFPDLISFRRQTITWNCPMM